MRKVLFRGKSIHDGEWLEGSFFDRGDKDDVYYIIPVELELEDCVSEAFFFDVAEYVVDPKTIGQYTGIKDCKGNRVFEGDILDVEGFKAEVIWKEQRGSYDFRGDELAKDLEENDWDNISNVLLNYMEFYVIGNIHDNQELLEDK